MPLPIPKPIPTDPWLSFQPGSWREYLDVQAFIAENHSPYLGDVDGLTGPSDRTQALWLQAQMLRQAQYALARRSQAHRVTLESQSEPEYLDQEEELIVGLPKQNPGSRESCTFLDCRQVALYGAEYLQQSAPLWQAVIPRVSALAQSYKIDLRRPAATAQEAIQWTYFAFLTCLEIGTYEKFTLAGIDTFFDIYLQRDIVRGILIEEEAQELIDDFLIKLRLVCSVLNAQGGEGLHLQLPIAEQGQVTRTSYRLLNTLYTLGAAAEPQFVVLWSADLPETLRQFCAELSTDTASLRYSRTMNPQTCQVHSYLPESLGKNYQQQAKVLCERIDQNLHHQNLGINIFKRESLEEILSNPHKFVPLTLQLSNQAVDLQTVTTAKRLEIVLGLLETLQ
jgi:formate C-acetyltransferase